MADSRRTLENEVLASVLYVDWPKLRLSWVMGNIFCPHFVVCGRALVIDGVVSSRRDDSGDGAGGELG